LKNRSDAEASEAQAEHWLKQNGITRLPIDPFEIASRLDIEVKAKNDAETGVSGMLLRSGDAFGIVYATHIKSPGFQRFSVAHELGHYLLNGHFEILFPNGNGVHLSRAGFVSVDKHEQEADHFASGLLMPDSLFRAALRRETEGLEAIEALHDKCITSITATAIRYAKKTTVPAVVIVSTGGRIDYAFVSNEMREFNGLAWPRKGELLPAGSLSLLFAQSQENIILSRRVSGTIDLRTWLGGSRKLDAKEEILGLGTYGKMLTVLTTDFLPDEDDEETDLQERWTPRFHR